MKVKTLSGSHHHQFVEYSWKAQLLIWLRQRANHRNDRYFTTNEQSTTCLRFHALLLLSQLHNNSFIRVQHTEKWSISIRQIAWITINLSTHKPRVIIKGRAIWVTISNRKRVKPEANMLNRRQEKLLWIAKMLCFLESYSSNDLTLTSHHN